MIAVALKLVRRQRQMMENLTALHTAKLTSAHRQVQLIVSLLAVLEAVKRNQRRRWTRKPRRKKKKRVKSLTRSTKIGRKRKVNMTTSQELLDRPRLQGKRTTSNSGTEAEVTPGGGRDLGRKVGAMPHLLAVGAQAWLPPALQDQLDLHCISEENKCREACS